MEISRRGGCGTADTQGDTWCCGYWRGIKEVIEPIKSSERLLKASLSRDVNLCEQQHGFMPRKTSTDSLFALGLSKEKYRQGRRSRRA